MNVQHKKRKRRDGALSSLNAAIDAMNIAKDALSATPAKAVVGSVSVILTMIRDSMINKTDYIELGLACADVCTALARGLDGKSLDELNGSVSEAIKQLTGTVTDIRGKIIKRGKRNIISRLFHAKNDKETIASWRLDLNRILHIFNAELAVNTHVNISDVRRDVANTHTVVSNIHDGVVSAQTIVSDVHRDVVSAHTIVSELQGNLAITHTLVSDIHNNLLQSQEGIDGRQRPIQVSDGHGTQVLTLTPSIPPGELPPPPPRACFGRDELIEEIVNLADNLTPIALIGAGGIGKTSIALTVLHHNRVKQRFGDNRRFIRCDQFPASRIHLLSRLSKVIGAGIDNPEDLTALRPFLSATKMLIVLDNAESILDPRGIDAQNVYAVVEELSQSANICLCITSRISTIPPDCKTLEIPTLSMEAARHTFYRIYKNNERPDLVSDTLEQLGFHPLAITLLATVAHHNKWDPVRLAREWDEHRTGVLQTDHNQSLAATIELSLSSLLFQELGSEARDLLGVIAFFPQGIDENNLEWLFPTISGRKKIFDKFCVLSLTYRSNGFVTMLAPLRDYLCPKDPKLSPLLCITKECYFRRLSVEVDPRSPGFKDTRWITSEDVNVEHLLDVFTSVDADSASVWDVCAYFMRHLYWHKQRLVVLKPKIEGLPDDHPSKLRCWLLLSRLFRSVGNYAEYKQLLIHTLKLRRERGDELQVAQTLRFLADANWRLRLYAEGIRQAGEALEIYRRDNHVLGQADCWKHLARLLYEDQQPEAAEEAASQAINLSNKEDPVTDCQCYRVLGDICHSRGDNEKAINHFEKALEIASSFAWQAQQFWILCSLAELFFIKGRPNEAHAHVERAKSHAVDSPYLFGRAVRLQASFWYKQRRFEAARCGVLGAAEAFEKLKATKDVEECGKLLRDIEEEMNQVASGEPEPQCPEDQMMAPTIAS